MGLDLGLSESNYVLAFAGCSYSKKVSHGSYLKQ
jgi:hypothetical protein